MRSPVPADPPCSNTSVGKGSLPGSSWVKALETQDRNLPIKRRVCLPGEALEGHKATSPPPGRLVQRRQSECGGCRGPLLCRGTPWPLRVTGEGGEHTPLPVHPSARSPALQHAARPLCSQAAASPARVTSQSFPCFGISLTPQGTRARSCKWRAPRGRRRRHKISVPEAPPLRFLIRRLPS